MDGLNYREFLKGVKPNKKLGQCFLMNKEIAKLEANFGIGKNVIEMGPGLGILTSALCKTAKSVLAIEKDERLFDMLKGEMKSKKLKLVHADFFSLGNSAFKNADMMISNVPYSLSSKTIFWLAEMDLPAVLCLQKEFVRHMVAGVGMDSYSRLSVMCGLRFTITKVFDVSRGSFYPAPRVDSALVHMKPKDIKISKSAAIILTALMTHKKKKLRNALIDSAAMLGMEHAELAKISAAVSGADKRPFQMQPEELLDAANEIESKIGLANQPNA
jgi:16S rRNA (adenine1518-N6/adenine1519-N6)-dimethyltransferase